MALEGCRLFMSLPGAEAWFQPYASASELVTEAGAEVLPSPEGATHVLIHSQAQSDYYQLKIYAGANKMHLVSLAWLFGSLEAGRPLDPTAHPLYSPFPADSIPTAAGFGHITQTSFTGTERTAVRALSLAAGLQFQAAMRYPTQPGASGGSVPDSTVLLMAKDVSQSSKKADVARQHGIPVVHLGWLIDCLDKWDVVNPALYTSPPFKPPSLVLEAPPPPPLASAAAPGGAFRETAVIEDSEDEGQQAEEAAAAPANDEEQAPAAAVAAVAAAEAPGDDEGAQEEQAGDDQRRARGSSPIGTAFFSAPSSKKAGTESELSGALGGGIAGPTQAMGMVGGLVGALCHETQAWMPAAPVSAAPKAAGAGGSGGGAAAAAGPRLFSAFKATEGDGGAEKERAKSPEPQEKEEGPAAVNGGDGGGEESDRSPSATPSQLSMGVKIPGGTVMDVEEVQKAEKTAAAAAKEKEEVAAEGADAVEEPPAAEDEAAAAPEFMSVPPGDGQEREESSDEDIGGGVGDDDGVSLGGEEDVEMADKDGKDADAVDGEAGEGENKEEGAPAAEGEEPAAAAVEAVPLETKKKKAKAKESEPVAAARGRARKQRGPARAPFSQVPVEEEAVAPEGRRTRQWRTSSEAAWKKAAAAVVEEEKEEEQEEKPKARGWRGRSKVAAAAAEEQVEEMEDEEEEAPRAAAKGAKGRKKKAVPAANALPKAAKKPKAAAPAPAAAEPSEPESEPEAMKEDAEEEEDDDFKPAVRKKPAAKKGAAGRKRPAAAAAAPAPAEEEKEKKAPAKKRAKAPAPAKPAPAPPAAAARRRVRIALSGLHSEEQEAVAAQLAPIPGATVVPGNQSHGWDASFTHVLAPRILRNQKSLAAMAAGAWLVAPSFADACEEAGRLVDEEPHELHAAGPTGAGTVEPGAAAFWRRRAEVTRGGAFAGLTVTVARTLAEPPSRADVCAILEAGGADLVAVGGGTQVDVVVATGATPPPAVRRQVEGGALLVHPLWVVDWVARPGEGLEEHVRGGRAGGGVSAAVAARAAAAAEAGFGAAHEPQVSLSL